MLRLTKEVRDQWLMDLRSGEFTQTRGAWHDDEGQCCLDVLWHRQTGKHYQEICGGFAEKFVGLYHEVKGESADDILIHLNDSGELTFPEIADWIEANLPPVEDVQ